MNENETKVAMVLGALVRGKAKREILSLCTGYGVECRFEEEKGLFESLYTLTIRGEARARFLLLHSLRWMFEEMSE